MTHQGEFIYQKAEHCLIGRFQGLYPFGGGLFGDPIAHLFFPLSRETTLTPWGAEGAPWQREALPGGAKRRPVRPPARNPDQLETIQHGPAETGIYLARHRVH